MISNNLTVNIQAQPHKESKEEESPRNTHSTDTEPEAESCFNLNQSSNVRIGQKTNETTQTFEHSKWKSRNGFTRLIEKLPTYEYEIPKKVRNNKNMQIENELVPLDARGASNNRFCDYFEAFLYIAQHCLKYHNRFTREHCRQYLKKCYILDFAHDEFIPIMTHLSSRKFNKYFQNAQKELKYL